MATHQLIAAKEFCNYHHIEVSFLQSLHDHGFIMLVDSNGDNFLEPDEILMAEKLVRLHYDLNINLEGLDVIQRLLQRHDELTNEINILQNKLEFHEGHSFSNDPDN